MATTVRPAPSDEAARAARPTRSSSRRGWWLVAALAVLAVIGTHLALMAYMRVPVIHPDELGYVQNAHYLARGGLRPTTEYYPGYSLLLVPLWWASRDPLTVWRGALVVNSLLAGLATVLAWHLLARLAPALGRAWRALIVGVTVAYPALVLFSDFSMSESAFAAAFIGVCLLAARAASRADWKPWFALGLGCGVLALIHPRGFAVYVAAGLLALAALLPLGWRRAAPPLGALGGALLGSFAVTRLLVSALKDPKSRFTSYSPGGILSRAASVHGLANLVSEAAGQLFYLSVATFGLVPFGLWVSLRCGWAWAKGDRRAVVLARAFPGVAFLGVWGVSSLFMNLGTRADKLIYGRYNDAAIAPLLLLALAEVAWPFGVADGAARRVARWRAVATWAAVGGVALVVSAAFTGLGHPGSEVHGPLNPVNVISIVPYIRHFGGKVEVLALLGVGLAGMAVLALVALRWPAVAAVGLAVAFAVLAVRTQATYIVPGTRARAGQDAVPRALAALRAHTGADLRCVAWDNPLADDFALYATQFDLPDQRIAPFGGNLGGPCGPLVVSPDAAFARRYPGARMVTSDPYAGVALWVLPGTATAASLSSTGWLFAAGPPAPLAPADRVGGLAVASPTVVVPSGGAVTVRLTASHPEGGAPWATMSTFAAGADAVRVALEWSAPPGTAVPAVPGCPAFSAPVPAPVACESADLPRVMLPAATGAVTATLHAVSATGQPLPPGTYTVHLGLYQQLVGTFAGSGTTTLQVRVTA
ncbi:MAG TPA: hypothetical protein VMU14_23410 [Acidimicrobiales bacterium]|nr:hypothetical protein [Acidimicrobiales bacterium]